MEKREALDGRNGCLNGWNNACKRETLDGWNECLYEGTSPGWKNAQPWMDGMDAWMEKREALDGWNGRLDG